MITEYEYEKLLLQNNARQNQSKRTSEIAHFNRHTRYIIDTLNEQAKIEDVYRKLCKYLQIHSILPFNDSLLEYLGYSLYEEEMKRRTGANNSDLVRHLTKLRIKQENKISLLKKTLENERRSGNTTELIHANDILPLVATLYDLSISGHEIHQQTEKLKFRSSNNEEREISVRLPTKANATQLMLQFKRCISQS